MFVITTQRYENRDCKVELIQVIAGKKESSPKNQKVSLDAEEEGDELANQVEEECLQTNFVTQTKQMRVAEIFSIQDKT